MGAEPPAAVAGIPPTGAASADEASATPDAGQSPHPWRRPARAAAVRRARRRRPGQPRRRPIWAAVDVVTSVLSAEWLLRTRPNGGDVVFLRALLTSAVLFALGVGAQQAAHAWVAAAGHASLAPWSPDWPWHFSGRALADGLAGTLVAHPDWYGALFAATYAALYARFSSQWTYVAGVYNQIMATQAQYPVEDAPPEVASARARVYAVWWAAFIEDAQDVHLAAKRSHAETIIWLLGRRDVRVAYTRTTYEGPRRYRALARRLRRAFGDAEYTRIQRDGAEAPDPAAPALGAEPAPVAPRVVRERAG